MRLVSITLFLMMPTKLFAVLKNYSYVFVGINQVSLLFHYEVTSYNSNFGQEYLRLFHVLAQFPFTTSEAELDLSPESVSVSSRVAGRLRFKCLKLKARAQLATKNEKFDS